MSKDPKRYTVTSALIYANGPIHIGHLAGCYLPADIFVRFLRLQEKDVLFISGTDEHGVPITIKARKEGKSPQEIVDFYHNQISKAFSEFGISFDFFSRTSKEIHHRTASDFFLNLYEKGIFTEKTTEQYYDPEAKQFLADRYIVGTCPKCGFENAYGDQCEKCGSSLSPEELINPKSMLSGAKPVLKKTKNWFLPLDKMQDKLKAYIESHSSSIDNLERWKPNVYGQCMSWLNEGLHERAMTRDLDWGVKVPSPPASEGGEGKVLYVWFDAPIGYISETKEVFPNDWEKYWKDKDTSLIHFIGKDNIVFHCLIFPAMLMAHGDYILPKDVPANEFLNLESAKISTSRNWAVWLHEYLEEMPNKQDELRYVLTSIAPENKDSEFTWKDFQARVNNELVAIYGNFINRTLVLTHKYFDGIVPEPTELNKDDKIILAGIKILKDEFKNLVSHYKFREANNKCMQIARIGNKYLADNEPWKLIKTNPERVKTAMYVALQISAILSVCFEPILPFSSKRLRNMLNLGDLKWKDIQQNEILKPGHKTNKPELLFQKIEDDLIEKQIAKLEANKKDNPSKKTVMPAKNTIQFDDFEKIDIRIGTIKSAEKHPDADKLLVLKIDTGLDERTIVSGIAQHYKPEEIVGKKVSVLINLAPRKLRGIESQGMILMAEDTEGKLAFVQPEKEIESGSIVR